MHMSGPVDTPLAQARLAIDGIDHALLLLLGARSRMAVRAGRCKARAGLPPCDPVREAQVQRRAEAKARRIGLSAVAAGDLAALAIAEARRAQGIAATPVASPAAPPPPGSTDPMHANRPADHVANAALRLVPPPKRWAPLLRTLPATLQQRLLERAMAGVLAAPFADGSLDFMQGRRLGIEVTDLGLHWVIEARGGALRAGDGDADASVRGTATDLLLLASRLEDADTLFFQRRLVLTGDTELGLTARNVLERLPWEAVPLALRIILNRGARLARRARAARTQKNPAA